MAHEERLLIIALNECAVNTVVEIMHSLMAKFIEGYDDKAGELFNKYFPKLYPEMQRKFIHTCLFESIANKLATKYGIAKPWKATNPDKPWTWEYVGFETDPYKTRDNEPTLNI